jgi:DNA-binding response OmpR family regulator
VSYIPHVLIATTDLTAATAIAAHLRLAGLLATTATSSTDGLTLVDRCLFDVIVLDASPDGLALADVCHAVRRTPLNRQATIVVLATTLPRDEDTRGLDVCLISVRGADGIARELARIAASHRGRHDVGWRPPLFLRNLQIDPARRVVRVRGTHVAVTRREFELLYVLASHPGLVFSRHRLIATLWPPGADITPRSVDALVGRLRQKIEADPAAPQLLLTVWGDGYRIAEH